MIISADISMPLVIKYVRLAFNYINRDFQGVIQKEEKTCTYLIKNNVWIYDFDERAEHFPPNAVSLDVSSSAWVVWYGHSCALTHRKTLIRSELAVSLHQHC